MSQVTQQSQSAGDSVAAKTATFQYDWQGEFTGVGRYQSAAGQPRCPGRVRLRQRGRLTSLAYTKSGNPNVLPSYAWTYDALGDMATAYNNTDGSATYTSDSTGQVTSAGYTGQPSESYSYDFNGNRANTATSLGRTTSCSPTARTTTNTTPTAIAVARWQSSGFDAAPPRPATRTSPITLRTTAIA